MTPGTLVNVAMFGGRYMRGTLIYVRGDTARVQLLNEDKSRAYKLSQVTPANDNKTTPPTLSAVPNTAPPPLISQPKPKTWRSARYLDFVRSLSCSSCQAPPRSEASHHGQHGTGIKPSDASCVPLCPACHRYYHQHGRWPSQTATETRASILIAQNKTLTAWVEKS